jgi:selenocysteine lyase/cysteine desulfurase
VSIPRPDVAPKLGDRSLFPHLEARAYLNHGGISPASEAVRLAVHALVDDYTRRGSSAFVTWLEQRQRLKAKLAALVGARPGDLALAPNTTRGITDVALCFPWRAGDRVVLFEGEFPSNVTPWQRAAALFGLEVVFQRAAAFLDDEGGALERLDDELRRGARLVAVSAVEFQTGLRMPLAAMASLCHARGAELFVDGVQACGAVPLDVVSTGIDYLACGSHKWLMGLEGAGFLYVAPERASTLRPFVAGWLSHEGALRFLFEGPGHLRYDRPLRSSADVFEGGNVNAAGCAALDASVSLLLELDVARVHEHVSRYLDALEGGLIARGFTSLRAARPEQRSNTLGVLAPPGASVVELARELGARGVVCALPDGVLRFTPHWPNGLDEVPGVLDAVDDALRASRDASQR